MQQRVGESQAAVCGTCVRTGVLREANLIRQPPPRENLDARWTGFPTVRARRGLQTTKNEEYDR